MDGKFLGRITFAEYGQCPDRPLMFGLQLGFKFAGSEAYDGGRYVENISEEYEWDSDDQRQKIFMENLEKLNRILTNAKVRYVSDLKGRPVEIYIKNNTFEEFRILTEVL